MLAACGTTLPAAEPATEPFRDARAVAFDPAGRAYVVDGDRGLCRALALGWACVRGTDDVQLVDPVALDVPDALTILVADRAGQIVRFDPGGLVRDVLLPPPGASHTNGDPRFAPVAVRRDALGRTLALDPARGLVRWDAVRQFAVLVPPERLPRSARALALDADGLVVLGDGVLVRYDAFGTETGREEASPEARAIVRDGDRLLLLWAQELREITGASYRMTPVAAPLGVAFHGRRACWLSRENLVCER